MSEQIIEEIFEGDCVPYEYEPKFVDENGVEQNYDFTGAVVTVNITWPGGGSWSDTSDGGGVTLNAGVISGQIPALQSANFPVGRQTLLRVRMLDTLGCLQTLFGGVIDVRAKEV